MDILYGSGTDPSGSQSMSRGNCCSKRIGSISDASSVFIHRSQNRNPPGQYALVHLPYNPAYILRHLRSDRLSQWFWNCWVLRQDKEKSPALHTVKALFPGIYGNSSYLIVIYVPCPILLSPFLFRPKKHLKTEKRDLGDGFISLLGK